MEIHLFIATQIWLPDQGFDKALLVCVGRCVLRLGRLEGRGGKCLGLKRHEFTSADRSFLR